MAKEPAEFPQTFPYFTDFPEALKNYGKDDWKQAVRDMWEALNKAHDEGNEIIGRDRASLVPPNHIANGHFGKWENGVPTDWTVTGTVTTTSQVSPRPGALEGKSSQNNSGLSIRVAGTSFAGYTQTIRFQPGELHSFSGFVYLDASEAGQTVEAVIEVESSGGDKQTKEFKIGTGAIVLDAWTGFPTAKMDCFTFRVPEADSTVTIRLLAKNGTVIFSDFAGAPGLHRSADLWNPSIADDVNAKSIEYTPTGANVANCTAVTPGRFDCTRVGDKMHCTGTVLVDPTAVIPTVTQFSLSLIIASALGAATDLLGFCWEVTGTGLTGTVYGRAAQDDALVVFTAINGNAVTIGVTFDYRLL